MIRRGFTVVELVIIITIMGILLVLAVVNVRGTQVNARDNERKGDIEAIAMSLENFYRSGWDEDTAGYGRYPSYNFMSGGDTDRTLSILGDISSQNLIAPGAASVNDSFIASTTNTQTTAANQPTLSQYIYQSIDSNNVRCTSGNMCRKFNLYYRLEADNTVYMVTSKNQ